MIIDQQLWAEIPCPVSILHCGGRGGVHPSFEHYAGPITYTTFEPSDDALDELNSLEISASANLTLNVMPTALSDKQQTILLNVYNSGDLNSVLKLDVNASQRLKYSGIQQLKTVSINATTIDRIVAQSREEPDFIILDTQGYDLNILKGAVSTLPKSVLGIRCEVEFLRLYENQPLFGDVQEFLTNYGFKLMRLENPGTSVTGTSYDSGPFSFERDDASPAWADALFALDNKTLFEGESSSGFYDRVIKKYIFSISHKCNSEALLLIHELYEVGMLENFFKNIPSLWATKLQSDIISRLRAVDSSDWQRKGGKPKLFRQLRKNLIAEVKKLQIN